MMAYQIHPKYTNVSDSLLYSTLIGGNRDESISSVCVVQGDEVYIAGPTGSLDFPRNIDEYGYPNGSYMPSQSDCFILKMNHSGLVFAAFVGGTGNDYPYDIVLDGKGNIYVTGSTWSSNFPATTSFGDWQVGIDCFEPVT